MAYKHDYDRALTRLNTIIARLNEGEALSVKALAEEFNVSDRTIQRDFNERLMTLYPIYQDKKRWKMQDGFKIEKSTNVEDIIVLDILEKMTDGLGAKFSTKAKHLLSKIKNEDFNPIYAKLNMEDVSDSLSIIGILEDAIKQKTSIECHYSFLDTQKILQLKPLKIANFEGIWYLIALDARNDILKKYHLKSISNIKLQGSTFSISKELEERLENSISIWFDVNEQPYEVELYLSPEAAKTLKRRPISKTQRVVKEYEDGSAEIVIKITHAMEILPIVKYWIPHIQVISPVSIKELIESDVKEFLEKL
jgi:predicted DNA-binding transcriptional regulator YafY